MTPESFTDPAIDNYVLTLDLVEGGLAGGTVTVGEISFELSGHDQIMLNDTLNDIVLLHSEEF